MATWPRGSASMSPEVERLTPHMERAIPSVMLSRRTIDSPVGVLTLVAGDAGLVAILWANDDPSRVRLGDTGDDAHHPVLVDTAAQLTAYFAGTRRLFDLPLDFRGTAFQRSVWSALLTIPYGEMRSYGAIATQIGQPGAARAVGAANGRNPISIVAPCHRVVGSTGRLTGFAGGLAAKERLLAMEQSSTRLL